MAMKQLTYCCVFVVVLIATMQLASADDQKVVKMVTSMMNLSVDPCQDFYAYANGAWLQENAVLPADKSSVERSITEIMDHNNDVLKLILSNPAHTVLFGFGQRCQDMASRNSAGASPVAQSVDRALSLSSTSFSSTKELLEFAAEASMSGASSTLFDVYSSGDPEVPEISVATLSQGGLTLPVGSIYLASDPSSVSLQGALRAYMAALFSAYGKSQSDAETLASQAYALEKAIAAGSVDPASMGDPFALYNPMNVSALSALANLPLDVYFATAVGRVPDHLVVDVPPFYAALGAAVNGASASERGAYLAYKILDGASTSLSQAFADANFEFYGRTLAGQREPSPLWLQCGNAATELYPTHTGVAFAQLSFSADAQQHVADMIVNIQRELRADIAELSWMTNATKARATAKITELLNVVGAPQNATMTSAPLGDVYGQTVINAAKRQYRKMADTIGKPVDRLAFQMAANIVNAYYDPPLNVLVILAGIAQSPYYNADFPPELSYGGIGVICGHETSHSLDSSGKDYNGRGRLVDWWTPADLRQFNDKVQCLIDQYSQYPAVPGNGSRPTVYVNGDLTKGENVADAGGVKFSYRAFVDSIGGERAAAQPSVVPGLTHSQLFFVGYCQGWAAVQSEQLALRLAASDPHSPPKWRCVGPLANLDTFSDAFQCPSGSPMNPPNKCVVW
jgi:putative endopeptidase